MNKYLLPALAFPILLQGCLIQDRRIERFGIDKLGNPPGKVVSAKELKDGGVKLVLEQSNGDNFPMIIRKGRDGALITDISICNNESWSELGTGFIVADSKRRYIEFVWLNIVVSGTYEGGEYPDYILIQSRDKLGTANHIYRYGGIQFSGQSGIYEINNVDMPDWVFNRSINFGNTSVK